MPNPSNSRETNLGLGTIFQEPKDDGSLDHDYPSPYGTMERELYQSYEESVAVHNSINASKQFNNINLSST